MMKQVIVVRTKFDKDGKKFTPRRGKIVAQACHASMKVFFDRMSKLYESNEYILHATDPMVEWIDGTFTKVCVKVESEDELLSIYKKALVESIPHALIEDSGQTEFDGVPTITAVAIGPDDEEKIDSITGNLPLY